MHLKNSVRTRSAKASVAVELASRKLQNFLRDARINKGHSQAALAEILGYASAQYVSDWERGVSSPPVKKLARLAKVLGIDLDRVFDLFVEAAKERVVNELREEFSRIRKSTKN